MAGLFYNHLHVIVCLYPLLLTSEDSKEVSHVTYRRKHQRIPNYLQSYKVRIIFLKYVQVTMSNKHSKSFKLRVPLSHISHYRIFY